MKKIITVFSIALGLVFGLYASTASASTLWNGASNDCQGLTVANFTTNSGYGNPCWQSTSINASPGDDVNIRVYYHNSSDLSGSPVTATNVRVTVNGSLAASTNHSFTATLSSDQGSISLGTVNFTTSSAQAISFIDARWTPNQTYSVTPFPNGQSASSILSSGVSIGSVAPGWNTQGSIVLGFHVASATPAPSTCTDPNASNYGSNGSCTYPPVQTCTISNFTANPSVITQGQASNLSWATTGCTNVSVLTLGNVNPTESRNVYPTSTTTYQLNASSANGILQTRQVVVTVNTVNATCTDPNASNYGGALPCNYPSTQTCVINSFTANPSSITTSTNGATASSNLSWSTTGCNAANISNIGNVNTTGNQNVYPASTTSYLLTAYGTSGAQVTRTVIVSVNQIAVNNCTISYFNANPSYINNNNTYGGSNSSNLTWSTNNCTSVNISNIGSVNQSGSQNVYPSYTTTYVLTAYGSNGASQTQSVTVSVNQQSFNNCYISYFTANPSYITQGQGSTLSWNTNNCTNVTISNINAYGSNYTNVSGNQSVYPTYTTTYILNAYGVNGGNQSQSVTITVAPTYTNVSNACAVTSIATNVNSSEATLNGIVSNNNGQLVSSYFEYGTTASFGSRTASFVSNSIYSQSIIGLSPNTLYYFRFVSQCGNGASYGNTETFRTDSNTPAATSGPTVITRYVQGTTVVGSASPIKLKIENRFQSIGVGDPIEYTVIYQNIGKSTLTRPILQVVVPKGIVFTNASRGTYSNDTHTLTVVLEDLVPGAQEGVVYIQAAVDSLPVNTAQIVTTAVLSYTNPSGAQENAIAYVLNVPKGASSLGAAAFFGGFLGLGLIGWLLLILIILIIILITRNYGRKQVTVQRVDPLGHNTTTTTTQHY